MGFLKSKSGGKQFPDVIRKREQIRKKRKIVLTMLVCTATLAVSVFLFDVHSTYDLYTKPMHGLWVNVNDSDLIVEFKDNGTYVDSYHNYPLTYFDYNSAVVMQDVFGNSTVVDRSFNMSKTLELYIDGTWGEYKYLSNNQDQSKYQEYFYDWESLVFNPTGNATTFDLKSNVSINSDDLQPQLRIYDDKKFSFEIGDYYTVGIVFSGDRTIALAEELNSGFSVFYHEDDILYGKELYSNVTCVPTMKNLTEVNGFALEGSSIDQDTSISYRWTEDGRVIRCLPTGQEVTYNYNVDSTGLVTLSSIDSSIIDDYMFFDEESHLLYRYVFVPDTWDNYLKEIGTEATDEYTFISPVSTSDAATGYFFDNTTLMLHDNKSIVNKIDSYDVDNLYDIYNISAAIQQEAQRRREAEAAQELAIEREALRLEAEQQELLRMQAAEDARLKAKHDLEYMLSQQTYSSSRNTSSIDFVYDTNLYPAGVSGEDVAGEISTDSRGLADGLEIADPEDSDAFWVIVNGIKKKVTLKSEG